MSVAPFRGFDLFLAAYPRLTPWATLCRRFQRLTAYCLLPTVSSAQQWACFASAHVWPEGAVCGHEEGGRAAAHGAAVGRHDADEAVEERPAVVVAVATTEQHV